MDISIGEYLRKRLRNKNISNQTAGNCIGLSESAFEKILTQTDIYPSRLLKLSELLNENLLDYYSDFDPIKSFKVKDMEANKAEVQNYLDKIELQKKIIETKEDLIETLKKYSTELEATIKRLNKST